MNMNKCKKRNPCMEVDHMNKNMQVILMLAIAATFIVTGGGCASLNPENFLPKSISLAGNDQRIGGSVNVQAVVPDIRKSKVFIRELANMPNVSFGKFLLSDGLSEAVVPDTARGKVALYDSCTLRVALEKAIAQKGLFQRIEQGDADYVLDVWLIDAIRLFDVLGEGMTIDMTAIWRLTRAKDGKVIFCDFANGHGGSHALGTNAALTAMETATREMIQKGLSKLTDRLTPLTALYAAGDWPSMGPVVPEDYKAMRGNWAKLQKGMPIEEVRKLIPSMPSYSCSVDRLFDTRYSPGPVEIFPNKTIVKPLKPCGWITNIWKRYSINGSLIDVREVVYEPVYPFYNLTFLDGVLTGFELRN
jgi:hypothetical protein